MHTASSGFFYLPDSTEISQVENVMEFCWCGKHLELSFLPQLTRSRHQWINHVLNFCRETALSVEVTTADRAKDLIDGRICGKRAVEDGKLPFQTTWDVIAAPTGLDHSCHKLKIHYAGKFTGFVETIKPFHLHDLSDNFVGDLRKGKRTSL